MKDLFNENLKNNKKIVSKTLRSLLNKHQNVDQQVKKQLFGKNLNYFPQKNLNFNKSKENQINSNIKNSFLDKITSFNDNNNHYISLKKKILQKCLVSQSNIKAFDIKNIQNQKESNPKFIILNGRTESFHLDKETNKILDINDNKIKLGPLKYISGRLKEKKNGDSASLKKKKAFSFHYLCKTTPNIKYDIILN